jgi:hypothetical protein
MSEKPYSSPGIAGALTFALTHTDMTTYVHTHALYFRCPPHVIVCQLSAKLSSYTAMALIHVDKRTFVHTYLHTYIQTYIHLQYTSGAHDPTVSEKLIHTYTQINTCTHIHCTLGAHDPTVSEKLHSSFEMAGTVIVALSLLLWASSMLSWVGRCLCVCVCVCMRALPHTCLCHMLYDIYIHTYIHSIIRQLVASSFCAIGMAIFVSAYEALRVQKAGSQEKNTGMYVLEEQSLAVRVCTYLLRSYRAPK